MDSKSDGPARGLEAPGLGELLHSVTPALENFVGGLEQAPAAGVHDMEVLARIANPPAEGPAQLDALLGEVLAAASVAVETAGPRYFGYIPSGGIVSSAVGELMSRTLNRYTTLADLAPGLVALEDSVLRWLTDIFGLPDAANGLVTTGGSQAILSMMIAAREKHFKNGDLGRGVIYLSDQAHHCVAKAAHIAGFPRSAIRLVPTSDGRHLDVEAAAAAVAADRVKGLKPFLIVGTAGTTNAGVVDPLEQLAALAHTEGLWFHVDACYGGFFQLTARGQSRLVGIKDANSISLDPHKSLFMPYGTGVLLMRDPALLAAAHGDEEPVEYMQDLAAMGLPDYAYLSSELTREHRGLRVWLPLHLHGIAAFRAALDEKLDLAHYAHRVLADQPQLEVDGAPELSTLTFRSRTSDEATQSLLQRVNGTGRMFVSSTRLDGKLTIRLCILSYRTHQEHVNEALDLITTHSRAC